LEVLLEAVKKSPVIEFALILLMTCLLCAGFAGYIALGAILFDFIKNKLKK